MSKLDTSKKKVSTSDGGTATRDVGVGLRLSLMSSYTLDVYASRPKNVGTQDVPVDALNSSISKTLGARKTLVRGYL